MPQANATWQRRVRRLLMLTGTATTVWLFFGYLFSRMRDARIRALKERREKEIIKAHFTSLISTISFTLYALLPTLEPQLFAAYPVESTSQALQAKTGSTGTNGVGSPTDTNTTTTTESTPADSLLLEHPDPASSAPASSSQITELGANLDESIISGATTLSVPTIAESVASVADSDITTSTSSDAEEHRNPAESWATEFTAASSGEHRDEDMLTASTLSQSISLPPTDTSSATPSPTSELSVLHSSPPRVLRSPPRPPADPRTKKELWRDLKVQSLTRAFSTAYLVPLIYLLTSSQLTILARTRYLADVKAANATRERERQEREAPPQPPRGLLSYFSVDAMGLGEYAERGAAAGASFIPKSVREWFFGVDPVATESPDVIAQREAQILAQNAESERIFLTYSWWLLHEGWRTIAGRVETAVERVFAPLGLKREITAETWDALVKELRASVETETDDNNDNVHLYDFTPLIVPASPLPPTFDECPLPLTPDEHGNYLVSLLSQTKEHVSSPDARLIVDKGVSAMLASLSEQLLGDGTSSRRFADLLPELNRWSRAVWEGIPDGGVEALLSLPEFEAFAALVFGDWAPRD